VSVWLSFFNQTERATRRLDHSFYNTEDRLTQVWKGNAGSGVLIASYGYDPFGRRLWKEVGGTRTYFHYSDEGLVAEMDISVGGYGPYIDASFTGTAQAVTAMTEAMQRTKINEDRYMQLKEWTSRKGFAKNPNAGWLKELEQMSKAKKVATMLGRVSGVLAGYNAVMDIIDCYKKCDAYDEHHEHCD